MSISLNYLLQDEAFLDPNKWKTDLCALKKLEIIKMLLFQFKKELARIKSKKKGKL